MALSERKPFGKTASIGNPTLRTRNSGSLPAAKFETLPTMLAPRTTRVNGFLMDRDLAHAIITAVAGHEPGKSRPGSCPNDPALRDEIDRLVASGHTQNASRGLAACLKQAPEAMDYLARRMFEAK